MKDNMDYTLECTWEDNLKNGEGILLDYNCVMAMKLTFVNDFVEGEGCIYDNGQVVFKGIWKEGKRCGHCQEFLNGRLIYDGEYLDDKRNGYGIEYDKEGMIEFEGEWISGSTGLKSITVGNNGKKVLTETNSDGKMKYVGGYKEGTVIRHGIGTEFNDNEKPISVNEYSEGINQRVIKQFKDKIMIVYNSEGKRVYEGEFKDNQKLKYPEDGAGRQFVDDILIYQGGFKNGVRDGHGFCYYINHILKYDGEWINGKANGIGKFYSEEGMLMAEGEFTDDIYTDSNLRVHVASGKIEEVKKMRGCFC